MITHYKLLLGFGMLAFASACSSTDTAAGGSAGAPPDSSNAGAAGAGDEPGPSSAGAAGARDEPGAGGEAGAGDEPSALTCMGVLQCAAECPDEDVDTCVGACVERTSKSSEAVTAAFLQCLVDNQCPDATCLQEKCKSELSACVSDGTSALDGTPSDEPPPTGAVPTELVGIWSSVGLSGGTSFQFETDGTTTQSFLSESNYGCALRTELSSTGVTTVTDDLLVYHRAEGTLATRTCGTVTTKPMAPANITYRYVLGTYEDGAAKLSLYLLSEDGSLSTALELHR